MDNKFIVLSDLHLERVQDKKRNLVLNIINNKIELFRKNNIEPIVVLAGDIHKAKLSYEWMKNINSKVIYIAGNHEFWDGDYYETIDYLKNNEPSNVKFLHNDFLVIEDYIFVGATLWTDVGINLNKDIFKLAGIRMNDNKFITAKNWYESEKNVNRLKEFFSYFNLEETLQHKKWNALIEVEENLKSWFFIKNIVEVLSIVDKTFSIKKKLQKDLNSSYEWWRIDKKIFNETQQKINIKDNNITWEILINNLFNLHNNYSISEKEKICLLIDKEEKDEIFKKIKLIQDLENKKLVMLTHHLPFYEEILVGSEMFSVEDKEKNKIINEVEKELFIIRSGDKYPEENYLMKTSKGDIARSRDISHIVNYYNYGSRLLNKNSLEKVSLWIHGHEHHFRHKEYIKGIPILANPCGNILSMLNIEDDRITLSDRYIALYNKEDKFDNKIINRIQNSLVVESSNITKEILPNAIQLWIVKNYNWEDHFKYLYKLEKASKEILLLSVAYTQREESENEKLYTSLASLEEKISIWLDSYNLNLYKLNKLHQDVVLAFSVRCEADFDLQRYYTNSIHTSLNAYEWTIGNLPAPEYLNDNVAGIFLAKKSFELKGNLKLAVRFGERFVNFLNKFSFEHVHQITEEDVNILNAFYENNLSKEKVAEKIREKWELFYKKTFTKHASKEFKDSLKDL